MKIFPPLVLVAVLLGVSGCGTSSTLDDTQFDGLRDQTKQFAKNMQAVGTDAGACSATGTSGSQPNLSIVQTCLGDALGKAKDGLGKIVTYTDNLSTQVDGACSTDLKAFGVAMTGAKETFAKAETQARGADLTAMQATLESLDSKKITSTGNAAEKACR